MSVQRKGSLGRRQWPLQEVHKATLHGPPASHVGDYNTYRTLVATCAAATRSTSGHGVWRSSSLANQLGSPHSDSAGTTSACSDTHGHVEGHVEEHLTNTLAWLSAART